MRDRFPDLHLVVAGEPEDQDPIAADVRQILESDPRIHPIGRCRDIARFYSACDFVVLPTYREGFPNVILESAAMAVPSIATRVPGCTDAVVDGVTGTLVPPSDPAGLAAAIERYALDPGLRRLHGTAARARVLRDFQPDAIYEDVYRHYCDLVRSVASAGARMGRSADRRFGLL